MEDFFERFAGGISKGMHEAISAGIQGKYSKPMLEGICRGIPCGSSKVILRKVFATFCVKYTKSLDNL